MGKWVGDGDSTSSPSPPRIKSWVKNFPRPLPEKKIGYKIIPVPSPNGKNPRGYPSPWGFLPSLVFQLQL